MRRRLPALLLGAAALAALAVALLAMRPERPRAVVLCIGDGLGASQITFARLLARGAGGRFAFESLPVVGLVSTWSASNAVTDSGAAATTLATGVKTSNRAIGVDAAGRSLDSLADLARDQGWRVGYVTNTTLTHATPAAFYGEALHRYDDTESLALQLLASAPEVALGGGAEDFLPPTQQGARRDGRDLLAEAAAAGYAVWTQPPERLPQPLPRRLLGIFAPDHLAFELDRRHGDAGAGQPTLEWMTRLALSILGDDGEPFFLLVEGGRIDHAAHSFDAAAMVPEVEAFDAAVGAVLEFQRRRPDTLVLVTADHATGGLTINDYVDWRSFARQRASIEAVTDAVRHPSRPLDLAGMAASSGLQDARPEHLDEIRATADDHDAKRVLGRLLAAERGVTWTPRVNPEDTKGHTGEDVPLYAGGPGAERFGGALDNGDLPLRLRELLGWRAAAAAEPVVQWRQD
ncbi:MAG TPA: alkaline phosphatase [Thermoanaerobaculia bacterium]|nr:alkaline phosphatase [Thermoanaerobaculia bacterium]